MERERPEYLPPIERRRWTFPWLAFWALVMAALVAGAVHQHVKTSSAWKDRFGKTAAQRFNEMPTIARKPSPERSAQRPLTEIDEKRINARSERVKREAQEMMRWEQENRRCINGVVFQRIPGGWENLPGLRC